MAAGSQTYRLPKTAAATRFRPWGTVSDNREFDKKTVLLVKDIEILKANLDSTLNQFRTDNEKRDLKIILAIGGLIGLATAILGFLIRLSS